MAVGDVFEIDACTDLFYLDNGAFDVPFYGGVYLVDAARPALVETGMGANVERVLDLLDVAGVAPADLGAILLTHVHLDHAGGAGLLASRCPNADVYVHEAGARHLVDPSRLVAGTKRAVGDQWQYYADPAPVPADRVVEVTDGDAVSLGDRTLTAHHVPGHAPHQVVYHDDRDDAVFTGDAAGIWVPPVDDVVPTTPPPQFDLEQALADVETIRGLDPSHLLFTHFGPGPDDVSGVLDDYRETLQAFVAAVREARAALDDDAAVVDRVTGGDLPAAAAWGDRKARAETAMNVRGVLRYLDTSPV
ncbi:MAG: MBL fold metallo-hydrolase [Halobacteriaceae archaeon]